MAKEILRMVMMVVVFSSVIFSVRGDTVTCREAITKMLPCQGFLVGNGEITASCCLNVQSLVSIAVTNQVRKTVCECFKKAAPAMGVNFDKAKQIPQLCNVDNLPEGLIDPNVNCAKAFDGQTRDGSMLNRHKLYEKRAFEPKAQGHKHKHNKGVGHGSSLLHMHPQGKN